ncbi:MAG TPA: carboxylesterase family protein, partial [Acidimicrobiia bacterium]|nr:carboxylesterase family protein [Acidimicrobiia bacterium]
FCKEAGVGDPAELMGLTVDAIIAAQQATVATVMPAVGLMPFHPMIDGDLITAPPHAALAGGAAAGVPLIAGTTADEMALFVRSSDEPLARDRVVGRIARYLRVDDARAAQIVDAYAGALGTADNAAIWQAFFGDNEMQVPCRALCEAHAPHGPTYTYLFTWEGPEVGACHGIDIPFPFGNFGDGWAEFVGLDNDGRALGRSMRDAWGAFARTGDPGWPRYSEAMIFGRASRAAPEHPLFVRAVSC